MNSELFTFDYVLIEGIGDIDYKVYREKYYHFNSKKTDFSELLGVSFLFDKEHAHSEFCKLKDYLERLDLSIDDHIVIIPCSMDILEFSFIMEEIQYIFDYKGYNADDMWRMVSIQELQIDGREILNMKFTFDEE